MTREALIHKCLHEDMRTRELQDQELRVLRLQEKELEKKQGPGWVLGIMACLYLMIMGPIQCAKVLF